MIWKNLHSVPSTLFPTNHCQEGNLNEISSTDLRHDSAIQDINENLCDDSAFVNGHCVLGQNYVVTPNDDVRGFGKVRLAQTQGDQISPASCRRTIRKGFFSEEILQ